MMLIPTLGNRIESGVTPSGLSHPGLIYTPFSSDDYEAIDGGGFVRKRLTVESPLRVVPVPVLNGCLADSWVLNLSLTYGAATLSETDLVLSYSGTTANSIGKKAGGGAFSSISYSGSVTSGDQTVSCDIEIGDMSGIEWEWTDGVWTVPLDVVISASDSNTGESGLFRLGRSLVAFGAALAGVPITFCGLTGNSYENQSPASDAFPSGSISLVPDGWLGHVP